MKSIAIVLGCAVHAALSCTWVSVATKEGKDLVGRSMELHGLRSEEFRKTADPHKWSLKRIPAGTGIDPADHSGLRCATVPNLTKWVAKYAHIGIGPKEDEFAGLSTLFDGMNTEGLSVDLHSFVQSQYQVPPKDSSGNQTRVCFASFTAYVLGNFASVADLKAALQNKDHPFYLVANEFEVMHADYSHWAIADRFHNNVVIEVVKGVLNIHNNTVRVMTNDPPFDFHLHNLQHFANLNTNWPDRSDITVDSEVGAVPTQDCHGTNLLGLPGDFTPSSRFAKTFYLRQFAETNIDIENVDEAISLVQGLLNSVHIPKGVVAYAHSLGDENYDFTQYATMKNLHDRIYYFRTYDDMQWKSLNLAQIDWSKTDEYELTSYNAGPRDVTKSF